LAKHLSSSTCKIAIPALLVSYSASVTAGTSVVEDSLDSANDADSSALRSSLPKVDEKAGLITVANATEQLTAYQYKGGKIDLNRVSFNQLQGIMDSFANSGCAQVTNDACRWKVLKLERTGRGKDAEQVAGIAAVLPANVKTAQHKPAAAIPIKVASRTPKPEIKIKPDVTVTSTISVHRPQVVETTVRQRLAIARWDQSFSAPHPDESAQLTADLATPVIVNLAKPSEVTVVVNNRKEPSQFLRAGLNTLDTDALPEGNYPIDVHIKNATDGETVVHQMFGRHRLTANKPKSPYGPFRREQGEKLVAQATSVNTNDVLLHTTIHSNLAESQTSNLHAADSRQAAISLYRQGNQYRLKVDGTIGRHSALGHALNAAYLGKELTVSIQGVDFVQAQDMTGSPTLAGLLDVRQQGTQPAIGRQQGPIVLSLAAVRHFNQNTGLLESRTELSLRLQDALDTVSTQTAKLQFSDDDDFGGTTLKVTLDKSDKYNETIAGKTQPLSEFEIHTPFINLS